MAARGRRSTPPSPTFNEPEPEVGLKIRRLKSGFAYYAEYKFGGGRCLYETIKAGSSREARRIYAARYKQLRKRTAPDCSRPEDRMTPRARVASALAATLRTLVEKRVISEAEACALLPEYAAPHISDADAGQGSIPDRVPV